MTMAHAKKHWMRRGSETAKRSGSIRSYNPKGGVPSSSISSQHQTGRSRVSRRLGTSAGKTGRGVRISRGRSR